MKIEHTADRTIITIRQSWISDYLACPESARRSMLDLDPPLETDAASLGTAVHAGIEAVLTGATRTEAADVLAHVLETQLNTAGFAWRKMTDDTQFFHKAFQAFDVWYEHIYPMVGEPFLVEQSFNLPWFEIEPKWKTDPLIEVRLSGTMDYINSQHLAWDWKTATGPYQMWEYDRYKVQPTAYTLALNLMGYDYGDSTPFNYGVVIRGKKVGDSKNHQVFTVSRDERHWRFFRRQVESIIETWLAVGTDRTWTLNDQGWKCSGTWCPAWTSCKGAEAGDKPHLVAA